MRIISGTAKGKKILLPDDQLTRPLKDLTKESIFNIIEHSNLFESKVKGSNYARFIFRCRFIWS